ncbi:hypothetical protein ACWEO4_47580 [Streptomyces sp. NPDC004393]
MAETWDEVQPAVHGARTWGQATVTSACTAWVLARARRIRR